MDFNLLFVERLNSSVCQIYVAEKENLLLNSKSALTARFQEIKMKIKED